MKENILKSDQKSVISSFSYRTLKNFWGQLPLLPLCSVPCTIAKCTGRKIVYHLPHDVQAGNLKLKIQQVLALDWTKYTKSCTTQVVAFLHSKKLFNFHENKMFWLYNCVVSMPAVLFNELNVEALEGAGLAAKLNSYVHCNFYQVANSQSLAMMTQNDFKTNEYFIINSTN